MEEITRRKAIKRMGQTVAAAAICASGVDALAACAPENNRKMKVLLINGSPRKSGNTYRMLQEAARSWRRTALRQRLPR